uniref:Secreted protein n=1 Tax=Steinernema glaseri TaxID=37863 RepID=A0A1I7Y4L6_9BILA
MVKHCSFAVLELLLILDEISVGSLFSSSKEGRSITFAEFDVNNVSTMFAFSLYLLDHIVFLVTTSALSAEDKHGDKNRSKTTALPTPLGYLDTATLIGFKRVYDTKSTMTEYDVHNRS